MRSERIVAALPASMNLGDKETWSNQDLTAAAQYLLTAEERRGISGDQIESRIEKKYAHRVAYIQVVEAYSGINATEVVMPMEPNNCSTEFEAGKSYLIYAWQDAETGQLKTGVCAGTSVVRSK
jgi:hypothetical protein